MTKRNRAHRAPPSGDESSERAARRKRAQGHIQEFGTSALGDRLTFNLGDEPVVCLSMLCQIVAQLSQRLTMTEAALRVLHRELKAPPIEKNRIVLP